KCRRNKSSFRRTGKRAFKSVRGSAKGIGPICSNRRANCAERRNAACRHSSNRIKEKTRLLPGFALQCVNDIFVWCHDVIATPGLSNHVAAAGVQDYPAALGVFEFIHGLTLYTPYALL